MRVAFLRAKGWKWTLMNPGKPQMPECSTYLLFMFSTASIPNMKSNSQDGASEKHHQREHTDISCEINRDQRFDGDPRSITAGCGKPVILSIRNSNPSMSQFPFGVSAIMAQSFAKPIVNLFLNDVLDLGLRDT